MDTSKRQAFLPNVLVRKISLNRLKNLQKLPYRQNSYPYPYTENLLTGQLCGET